MARDALYGPFNLSSASFESGAKVQRMDLRERSANPNRHPWELSRADTVLQLLAENARGTGTRYADVGSGDLYFAKRLRALTDAPIYAVDVNYVDQGSEAQLVICTDLNQVPSRSVDCAVLMDVLEHVDDDVGLLQGLGRIVAPGGQLLITVPAHEFLWSDHDVFLGHHRRYNRRLLRDVIQRGGWDVVECFHPYAVPYFVRTLSVGLARVGVRPRHSSTVSVWPYSSQHLITRIVRALLSCDFRFSRLLGEGPLSGGGLSICAICRQISA